LVFAITEKCFQLGDHSAIKIDENKKKTGSLKMSSFTSDFWNRLLPGLFTPSGACVIISEIFLPKKLTKNWSFLFIHAFLRRFYGQY
jgi:hypothetical protein